jgi:integrase
MATPAQQKKEVTWPQLQSIAELASASGDAIAQRDSCMIMLAYHTFLRISEVARMDREDITFTTEPVNGTPTLIMRVHVNRMAKNDHKRVGHEGLVGERAPNVKFCMVRQMQAYLVASAPKGPQSSRTPLFRKEDGGRMSEDAPRGRLKHWLQLTGVQDASEYGFHSLRAGGATDAAKSGVEERHIKAHGNWKSDAVRVYIRLDIEERLMASAAIGERKLEEEDDEQDE